MGLLFLSEFLLNLFVGLLLTEAICLTLLLKNGEGSLLPTLEIVLVIVQENAHVRSFELFDFLFGHNHKDGGHNIWAMSIHEHIFGNFLFIYDISKVLLQEWGAVLLSQMIQLVSHIRLLINYLFQPVVRGFLRGLDLGSENFERLIHLESDLVPFKVLDIILYLDLLGSSSVATDFND